MRCAVLGGSLAFSALGCGTLWGFEDPIPLTDGGQATSGPLESGAARMVADAGVEGSAVDAGDPSAACACLPPPGDASWQGPFAFYEGQEPAPPCPPSYDKRPFVDAYDAPDAAPPATCACSCAPPTGVCSAPVATSFNDDRCAKMPCAGDVTLAVGCTALNPMGCGGGGGHRVTVSAPMVVDAGCASLATVDAGPPPWTGNARLCALAAPPSREGCGATRLCVPPAGGGFSPGTYCIARPGASSCPLVDYTVSHLFYQGFDDTRGCAPCACAAPMTVTCSNATVTAYDDMTCGHVPGTSVAPGACVPASSLSATASAVSGEPCAAVGGQPQGSFLPTSPWTVCCNQ